MVTHCVVLKEAGVDEIVVVVGYGGTLVQDVLGSRVKYALQREPRGTANAAAAAGDLMREYGGRAVIMQGDNPLLSASTIQRLVQAIHEDAVGSLLAFSVENPMAGGPIVRDGEDRFVEVAHEDDYAGTQRPIKEINAGTYCFEVDMFLDVLSSLQTCTARGGGELADLPGALVGAGNRIEVVPPYDILEELRVNDRDRLSFAETAKEIRYAEAMLPMLDSLFKSQRN